MTLYALTMVLIIASNMAYHVSQRAIAPTVHPFVSLAITYSVSLVAILLLLPAVSGGRIPWEQFRQANWASYVLALAVVGLEFGFLKAYRVGWNISHAGLYSNAAAAILLVPIGIFFFQERISWSHALGMTLCVSGLVLMSA